MEMKQNLLILKDTNEILTNFSVDVKTMDIVIGQFHYEHGPELFPNDETEFKERPEVLFPAKWDDNVLFMTRSGNYFILAIGVLSNAISTPRGALQLTVALYSDKVCFSSKHKKFLMEAAATLRDAKEIKTEEIREMAKESNILITESTSVLRSYDMFEGSNTICNLFGGKAKDLLTLWKARMLKDKLSFTFTDDITVASYVCYFFSLCCTPYRQAEDSSYHIELVQTNVFENDPWEICCVTHPLLQRNPRIPVVYDKGNFVNLGEDEKWLSNGSGGIIRKLESVLATKNDRIVLETLIKETQKAIFVSKKKVVDTQDLDYILLDKKNIKFIKELAELQDNYPDFDVSDYLCC